MNTIQTTSFELAIYSQGDKNADKLALVLPGRLDTKDYPHMRSHVDFLASLGYLAVTFDPPGTWESPGDIELYTMTNYLKAINELIEYFGDKPTVVIGHSRGGTMAMLAGVTNPRITHFAAIMSRASASALAQGTSVGAPEINYRDLPGNPLEKTRFDLPYAYFVDAAQYDMLEGLSTCTKPKMFVMGTRDVLVTLESVQKTYDTAAEPKLLKELDSEHDYRFSPELIAEVNTLLGDFLSEAR